MKQFPNFGEAISARALLWRPGASFAARAEAMFTLPPRVDSSRQGDASNSSSAHSRKERHRTRSPISRSDLPLEEAGNSAWAPPAWGTGMEKVDDWIRGRGIAPEVLEKFAELPKHQRLKIACNTIEKKVDNVDAWLNACIRNQMNTIMANRVLDGASVWPERQRRRDRSRSPPHRSRQDQAPSSIAAGGSPTRDAHVRTGTEPAEEAIAMRKHWPNDKSSFIAAVADNLDEEVMEQFLSLEPEDQCGIGFIFMIAAARDDTKIERNKQVKAWLERLEELRGATGKSLVRSPSQGSVANRIHVQIVLAGMPSVMAGTIVSVLSQVTPSIHPDIHAEYFPSIFIETSKDDSISVVAVADAFRRPFHTGIRDMEDFRNQYEGLMEQWTKLNTKFIFVAMVGMASKPDEKICDLEVDRLHRTDTQWLWAFINAADVTRQQTRDEDVAEILFGPQAQAFHPQLSNAWGSVTSPCAAGHPKIPVTIPQVWSTPSGFTVLSVVDNPAVNTMLESSNSPDFASFMTKYPGVAIPPSMVARLMVMKLFKERPLKKEEEDMLKAVSVKTESGTHTSMGRSQFMSLCGYSGTPAEKLLEKVAQCRKLVFPTTGEAASKPSKGTSPCGQQRYCRQCEKLFALLDRGYPAHIVCDVLLALFSKVMPTWTGGEPCDTAMWARKADSGRDHQCGPACTGRM